MTNHDRARAMLDELITDPDTTKEALLWLKQTNPQRYEVVYDLLRRIAWPDHAASYTQARPDHSDYSDYSAAEVREMLRAAYLEGFDAAGGDAWSVAPHRFVGYVHADGYVEGMY